jgi:hypothetical protein
MSTTPKNGQVWINRFNRIAWKVIWVGSKFVCGVPTKNYSTLHYDVYTYNINEWYRIFEFMCNDCQTHGTPTFGNKIRFKITKRNKKVLTKNGIILSGMYLPWTRWHVIVPGELKSYVLEPENIIEFQLPSGEWSNANVLWNRPKDGDYDPNLRFVD